MLVLNFLCKKYIHFYHASLQQAFQLFQSSFFQAERINHCEGHVIFKDIEHQIEENFLYHFLHYSFFIDIFLKFRRILHPTQNCLLDVFATLLICINY